MMYQTNSMMSTWIWVILILIVVAILVANDASKKGHNGILWAFVVVIMPMMGIFFYLIFISLNPVAGVTTYRQTTTVAPRTVATGNTVEYGQTYQAPVEEVAVGKYCISCGAANAEIADFCNKCGAKIPTM